MLDHDKAVEAVRLVDQAVDCFINDRCGPGEDEQYESAIAFLRRYIAAAREHSSASPLRVDLDMLDRLALVGEMCGCGASVPTAILRAAVAELRAHRSREAFLDCPACEQPCRELPGDPNPQWRDGDSGECACGAEVMVYADGEHAHLVLLEDGDG